jgi:hypothetical protein
MHLIVPCLIVGPLCGWPCAMGHKGLAAKAVLWAGFLCYYSCVILLNYKFSNYYLFTSLQIDKIHSPR